MTSTLPLLKEKDKWYVFRSFPKTFKVAGFGVGKSWSGFANPFSG